MYLHIGNNRTVRSGELVGVFDTDAATVSPITRKYLSAAQKKGQVLSATDDIPKSFVVIAAGCDPHRKAAKKRRAAKRADKKAAYGVILSKLAPASLTGRIAYRRF